jgi:hypothetical protein
MPALALAEFETVLRSSPKRFNATYGVARATELSSDRNSANERYSELLQLCGQVDAQRLEVQNARAFLQRRQ